MTFTRTAQTKRCVDCGVLKNRLKAFKPRWGRCPAHRDHDRPSPVNCPDCVRLKTSNIRQPRCIDCDRVRDKKRKREDRQRRRPKIQSMVQDDRHVVAHIEHTSAAPPSSETTALLRSAVLDHVRQTCRAPRGHEWSISTMSITHDESTGRIEARARLSAQPSARVSRVTRTHASAPESP